MANALESLIGNFTLAELAQRSGKSVAQIVAFALNGAPSRAAKNGFAAARSSGKAVNTRTRQGRAEFDARVFEAIKQAGSAKAADIEGVGGDALQRRASLHRLIAAKKIRREGVARATVYKAKP